MLGTETFCHVIERDAAGVLQRSVRMRQARQCVRRARTDLQEYINKAHREENEHTCKLSAPARRRAAKLRTLAITRLQRFALEILDMMAVRR